MYYSGDLISTLSVALAADEAETTVTLADAGDLAVGDDIYVNAEKMDVTARTSNELTVTRAIDSTSLGAHFAGTGVYLDDRRSFFFTQSHASRADVLDMDAYQVGGGVSGGGQESPVGVLTLTADLVPTDFFKWTSGAGFLRGKFDLTVQRFVDAWVSFPGLLLLLTIMTIVEQGNLHNYQLGKNSCD